MLTTCAYILEFRKIPRNRKGRKLKSKGPCFYLLPYPSQTLSLPLILLLANYTLLHRTYYHPSMPGCLPNKKAKNLSPPLSPSPPPSHPAAALPPSTVHPPPPELHADSQGWLDHLSCCASEHSISWYRRMGGSLTRRWIRREYQLITAKIPTRACICKLPRCREY